MSLLEKNAEAPADARIGEFLRHLATDKDASVYTQRNYRQALLEFHRWHQGERHQAPRWEALQRDDFRSYLRFLGRGKLSRAAIQLRFCALRSLPLWRLHSLPFPDRSRHGRKSRRRRQPQPSPTPIRPHPRAPQNQTSRSAKIRP